MNLQKIAHTWSKDFFALKSVLVYKMAKDKGFLSSRLNKYNMTAETAQI